MYRHGILSTASIISRFINGIKSVGDEVVAIASRNKEKADLYAKDYGIKKAYGSYEELLFDKEVDIVYIPLINSLHFKYAKIALEHKKHVILEKPFTTNLKDAKELFEIARNNNRFLMEGVKNVFLPSTRFVIDNLNIIGKVYKITTQQGSANPFPKDHWMYDFEKGGGAYYGSAEYVYHYLQYIFKSTIKEVHGTYRPSHNKSDAACAFQFKIGDIEVFSTIDMQHETTCQAVFYGENGKIVIDHFWRSHDVWIYKNDILAAQYHDEGNEFIFEALHIQDCLNKNLILSPIENQNLTLPSIKMIEDLYKQWNFIKD